MRFAPALRFAVAVSWFVLTSSASVRAEEMLVCPVEEDGNAPVLVRDYNPAGSPLSFPTQETDSRTALNPEFILCGDLPEGDAPSAVTFTPDGSQVVISHWESQNLILLDASTRTFVTAIPVSGSPIDVAVSPDGLYAVTANVFEDTASIVDLTAAAEVAVVPVGDQPGLVAVSPDGSTAAVGNTVDGSVSIIDLATRTETDRIPGLGYVGSLSFNFESGAVALRFGRFHFVDDQTLVNADYYGDQIQFVDLGTSSVHNVPCADSPRDIDVSADRSIAAVSHAGSAQTVSVVDLLTQSITKTIPTGADLFGPIDVNLDGTKAVVAIQNACRVVNLVTSAVSADINTASVNQIRTTADGLYALTIGFRGSLVSYTTETLVQDLNNVVSTAVGDTSPTEPRGVMVANVFGEDAVFVNTAGASGFLEGVVPSGAPPEGDRARVVALSSGGEIAVVTNILSDNASLINPATATVLGIVAVGDRPAEVEITPDGTQAVVANLDSYFSSVIDLGSQNVTNVAMGRRGSEVEISPDGLYAYVAVVADGDGVYRINLQTLALDGPKIATGNMGGIGYNFSQNSGMTLSHDGRTLVTCNSFDDTISIIDTATWTLDATVGVGDFPVRATFTADDMLIYVSNRDSDTVSAVRNEGGGSSVDATYAVGDQPFDVRVAPSGSVLYVLSHADHTVRFIDVGTGFTLHSVVLPNPAGGMAMNPAGTELYLPTGSFSVSIGPGPLVGITRSGEFSVIDTGAATISDQVDTGFPASDLAYDAASGRLAFPSPVADGLFTLVTGNPATVETHGAGTGVNIQLSSGQPAQGSLAFRITVPADGPTTLTLFDVAGRERMRLDRELSAGTHEVGLDTASGRAASVESGIYYARLVTAGGSASCKVVILH